MDKGIEGKPSTKRAKGSAVPSTDTKSTVDELIDQARVDLLKVHAMLSEMEMRRHGRKFNVDLSNAVQLLSQSMTFLGKYLRSRREKGTYGKEEI